MFNSITAARGTGAASLSRGDGPEIAGRLCSMRRRKEARRLLFCLQQFLR